MALTRSIGAYDDGTALVPGVGTTPLDTRKSLSALWASAGVVPGGPSPLVTGTTGFAYSVAGPVPFVTTRGPSDGFAMFTNDGAATVTCPGAPGSGLQRIDILWVRHPTNTENSDTSSMPIFGVASGTAVSSSPAAPSIPTGALELARNTMLSTATSTASTGNTIAQTAAIATRPTAPLTAVEKGQADFYAGTILGTEVVTATTLVSAAITLATQARVRINLDLSLKTNPGSALAWVNIYVDTTKVRARQALNNAVIVMDGGAHLDVDVAAGAHTVRVDVISASGASQNFSYNSGLLGIYW